MKTKYLLMMGLFIQGLLSTFNAIAQSILFDFNNAPIYTSLPITQTVSGVTAHFSASGQGYSIQNANAMGFTPAGFSGRVIYPNSVYLADLKVKFDQTLTAFSIMYSCQELGCDDAATMKVTAYHNGALVGFNTKTAAFPGTWPVDTLSCTFAQGFDSVVVHYNSPPPTCGDYGVIFLADNMKVTVAVPTILNLKFFLEGYYTGNGTMNPVLLNQGIGANSLNADSVTIELHNTTTPYALFKSSASILKTNGTLSLSFLPAFSGSYYVVVKHRNSITTWSSTPVLLGATPATYDFTIASSKAYGSNMKSQGSGIWAFYSGDLDHDENVDLLDASILETGINFFQYGHLAADINGDGNVDLLDLPLMETNISNFVYSIHP